MQNVSMKSINLKAHYINLLRQLHKRKDLLKFDKHLIKFKRKIIIFCKKHSNMLH